MLDLSRAREDGLLTQDEYDDLTRNTNRRLKEIGFGEGMLDDQELVVYLGGNGMLDRDKDGRIEVRFCMDALAAYDCELLGEKAYRRIVERLGAKLRTVDYEKLDLGGKHLLLSADPDGHFRVDETGELEITLCSFDLIRGLYRPIR